MLALKSGDKKVALRQARRLKVLTTSKGKCETFIDRIDEVLTSVADAEATRKVSNVYLWELHHVCQHGFFKYDESISGNQSIGLCCIAEFFFTFC